MADTKYPPLLKNTPFVGSASNRVVHRTEANCPQALEISPNERWYIKDIPYDGNYLMCPFCFPQAEESVPETVPAVEPGQEAPRRKRATRAKTATVKSPATAAAPAKKKVASAKKPAAKSAAAAKKSGARPAATTAAAAKPARARRSPAK